MVTVTEAVVGGIVDIGEAVEEAEIADLGEVAEEAVEAEDMVVEEVAGAEAEDTGVGEVEVTVVENPTLMRARSIWI